MLFNLTKPIPLFDAVWTGNEMVKINTDASYIEAQDNVLYNLLTNQHTYFDTFGINWSGVAEPYWQKPVIINRFSAIKSYRTAYLRLTFSVMNGTPGDAALFILNQPGVTENSGLYAYVHTEVAAEHQSGTMINTHKKISSHVAQVLIGNYKLDAFTDPEEGFTKIMADTKVRFLGISKTDNVSVRCRCELVGGLLA